MEWARGAWLVLCPAQIVRWARIPLLRAVLVLVLVLSALQVWVWIGIAFTAIAVILTFD